MLGVGFGDAERGCGGRAEVGGARREWTPRGSTGVDAKRPDRRFRPGLFGDANQSFRRSCVFSEKTWMFAGSIVFSLMVVPRWDGLRAETRATIC